jgi:DNA-binding transcriptional LysR family regulator
MDNIDSYRIFLEVARQGSFSKGALKLFITQPAVSQAISNLEERNGVRLFQRMPRGVVLTNEGRILMEYLEPAFNLIKDAERRLQSARNKKMGEVRISASDTFCMYYLPPYLKKFSKKYPNIRLNIANKTSSETIEVLKSGNADLGIINLGNSHDEKLKIWKKNELESYFIMKRGIRKYDDYTSPEQLASLPMMTLEKGTTTREHLDQYFEEAGVKFTPFMELGSVELLLRFTSLGMGVSCIAKDFLEKSPYDKKIDIIRPDVPIRKRSIGVVTLNSSVVSGAAKAFIDVMTEEK